MPFVSAKALVRAHPPPPHRPVRFPPRSSDALALPAPQPRQSARRMPRRIPSATECHRLGKHCVFLHLPERKRRPQSARVEYPTGQASNFQALENKLDSLSAEIAALEQQINTFGSTSQSSSPAAVESVANNIANSRPARQ